MVTCFHSRYRPALALSMLLALGAATGTASLSGKDLVTALQRGGCVILMRHASSPAGAPAQPDSGNPGHERQLDEAGRASARAMGGALRQLRVPIGQVLSSPTYRALETARLADLRPVETYDQLGDAGQSVLADSSGARGAWLRSQVARAPKVGTDTVIITHAPNITEAFPTEGASLSEGEALIFRPDGRGAASLVAQMKIQDWPRLAAITGSAGSP